MGGAASNEHALARQGPALLGGREGRLQNRLVGGQLALAFFAAGHQPAHGVHHHHAALLQGLQAGLSGRVGQHAGVHGRGHHHGAIVDKRDGRQHVVGDAGGEAIEGVGRGRGDEQEIRLPRPVNVRHAPGFGLIKDRLQHGLPSKSLEQCRLHKLLRAFGEAGAHGEPRSHQVACQVGGAVGGHAAGDA